MKKVISVGLFLVLGLVVSCSSETNNPPGCGTGPACTGGQVCTAGVCVTPPPPLGCKVASDCTGTSNACNSSNVCVCGAKAGAVACTGGNYCSESTSTCEKSRTIFATQYSVTPGTVYTAGNYNSTSTTIASAADADTVCKAAALINTTKTPGTYQALIGKKLVTPLGRIGLANDPVPVFNTASKQVAASVNALGALDVSLGAAILNETGVVMSGINIFTGSTALNQTSVAGNNCNDWLATGTLGTPTVGLGSSLGASSWWNNTTATGASCTTAAPIYCIQVD